VQSDAGGSVNIAGGFDGGRIVLAQHVIAQTQYNLGGVAPELWGRTNRFVGKDAGRDNTTGISNTSSGKRLDEAIQLHLQFLFWKPCWSRQHDRPAAIHFRHFTASTSTTGFGNSFFGSGQVLPTPRES